MSRDIEKLFRDTLKDHKINPPGKIWDQLEENYHRKKVFSFTHIAKMAAAMVLLALSVYVLQENVEKTSPDKQLSGNSSSEIAGQDNQEGTSEDPLAINNEKEAGGEVINSDQGSTESGSLNNTSNSSGPINKVKSQEPKNSNNKKSRKPENFADQYKGNLQLGRISAKGFQELMDQENPGTNIVDKISIVPIPSGREEISPSGKALPSWVKTIEILDDVENAPVGLAELREAKDALIANALTKTIKGKNKDN